jgi:hypothetical protein
MMRLFGASAPLRIGVVIVIAVVVQLVTHTWWLAIVLPVSYFVAKEIAGMVQPSIALALLGTEPRIRVAAFVCDNVAFVAALLGYFLLQNASSDGAGLGRFAVFEGVVIVFVAVWAYLGSAALRRSSRAV